MSMMAAKPKVLHASFSLMFPDMETVLSSHLLTEIHTYDNTQYVAHGSTTNNLMVYVAKKISTAQGSVQTQRMYGSNTRIPYCRSGQYLSDLQI